MATAVQQLGAWRDGRPRLALPQGPVLVLTAHPDDEVLAFGGTMARLVDAGIDVAVLCATAGEATLAGRSSVATTARRRRAELGAACAVLGVERVECLDLPDGRLHTVVAQLASVVRDRLTTARPAAVLLPWWRDAHSDHRALSAALVRADAGHPVQVWAGEIWTPVPATHVVDIDGPATTRKRAALAAHTTAARTLQLDAVFGLNRYRAFAAGASCEMAEGYLVASLEDYRALVGDRRGQPLARSAAGSVRRQPTSARDSASGSAASIRDRHVLCSVKSST